jgi:hypothetical protein
VRRRLSVGLPLDQAPPPCAAKRRFADVAPALHKKFLPRAHPHGVDSFSGFGAWQCAASIVARYGGKCWSLSLLLTIFTTQFNKEMGSQRRRR